MTSIKKVDDKLIIIDGASTHRSIMIFLMSSIVFQGLVYGYQFFTSEPSFIHYIWIVLGPLGLVLLYVFIFKRTGKSEIGMNDMEYAHFKNTLGATSFYLQLKNGKKRNLHLTIKTKSDVKHYCEKLEEMGVHVRQATA